MQSELHIIEQVCFLKVVIYTKLDGVGGGGVVA